MFFKLLLTLKSTALNNYRDENKFSSIKTKKYLFMRVVSADQRWDLVVVLLTFCHSNTCRTNSDSALHQSAMNPKPQESFSGGSQELQPKRGEGASGYRHSCFALLMC